jgi:hypothetical protein
LLLVLASFLATIPAAHAEGIVLQASAIHWSVVVRDEGSSIPVLFKWGSGSYNARGSVKRGDDGLSLHGSLKISGREKPINIRVVRHGCFVAGQPHQWDVYITVEGETTFEPGCGDYREAKA